MNNKTQEDSEQPVKEAVLKAMNEEIQSTAPENEKSSKKKTPEKTAETEGKISYASNSVRIADTVGTIVLGMLSLFLLLALLSAHRRERKNIRNQARLS